MTDQIEQESAAFDFDAHGRAATDKFKDVRQFYEDCSKVIETIMVQALDSDPARIHSVDSRAKTVASFHRKVMRPSAENPNQPKYSNPFQQITDLAGLRVITYFIEDLSRVDQIIVNEFEILEKTNRSTLLEDEEKLGYQSVHYLVRLKENRAELSEYQRFANTTVEIQVRTILQHAWAEIEHDIQYKSVEALPTGIKRRFLSLAGLIEIADREFQAIATEEGRIRSDAKKSIDLGQLTDVEITPDALKQYLDSRFGPDGRMSDWNYGWNARMLKRLGFRNLGQLDECIRGYDDDAITKVFWFGRQGQLRRFEDVVMVAMGGSDHYWSKHPYAEFDFWPDRRESAAEQLESAGLEFGSYVPGE
ncbi:GTP pyrophosphokinase [Kribbella speibonae]|uniref:GTP pyrophosphokinase n=1 Tax=Kribbella speibonae TaxID=1572660 RepID=UPI0013F3CE9B|nr:hypothetical protein [Kribbella speibonae]